MAKKLEVAITGNTTGLGKAFGDSETRAGRWGSKMSGIAGKVGGAFTKTFKAVSTGAVVAGVAVAAALGSTIPAASSQAEALSKVEQVFGSASAEVKAWADTSADAFGQSKTQALEAAGTYGNLFQSFGLGADAAKQMSIGLVELASDLASFNNTSVDDALQALQSGVSGETEPLKRYGIALNEAGLKAEALNLGLIKATSSSAAITSAQIAEEKAQAALAAATKKYGADSLEARDASAKLKTASEKLANVVGGKLPAALTPAQKAQASYSLIMKASALAQGDFSRTSDGLANKQRILTAKLEDMKAKVGGGLLPVVLALANAGERYLLPVIEEVAGGVRAFIAAAADPSGGVTSSGLAGRIESLGIAARKVFDGYVLPAFREIRGGLRAFIAAWKDGSDEVTSSGLAGWIESLGVHFRNAFDVIQRNWGKVSDAVSTGAEKIAAGLGAAYRAVQPVVRAVADFIRANPKPVFAALAVVIGGVLVSSLWSLAVSMAAAFAPVYLIVGAIALLAGGLVLAYQKVDWFRNAVDATASFITTTAVPALQQFWSWFSEKILPVLQRVVDFYATAWVAVIKGYVAYIRLVVTAATELWGYFSRNILPIFQQVADHLIGHFKTSLGVARDAMNWIIEKSMVIYDWFNTNILPTLTVVADFLAGQFRDSLAAARDGMKWIIDKAKSIWNWLKKVVDIGKNAADTVKDIASAGGGVVSDVAGAIPGLAKGGRAPVGTPYWVGENGPELRVDDRPGTIIPNHKIATPARSVGVSTKRADQRPLVVQINGPVYGIEDLADQTIAAINRKTRANRRSPLVSL